MGTKPRKLYAVETVRGVLVEAKRRKKDAEKASVRARRKGIKVVLVEYRSR